MNDISWKRALGLVIILLILAVIIVVLIDGSAFASTWSYNTTWNGVNGASYNINGAGLHWILSGHGSMSGASGILVITRSDGSTQTVNGYHNNGALHFNTAGVVGAHVNIAKAYWNGGSDSAFLKISSINYVEGTTTTTKPPCTTTTTKPPCTTTTSSTTTTTEKETTTTEEETTTTQPKDTTTSSNPLTTVTLIQTGFGPPPSNNLPYYLIGGFGILLLGGTLVRSVIKNKGE